MRPRLQDVYNNVVHEMRLPGSNLLYGIPVVMDTDDESFQPSMAVELTYNGQSIGVLEIESKWQPDKATEALKCYGTSSLEHPGVLMIATERGKYYIGGKVRTPGPLPFATAMLSHGVLARVHFVVRVLCNVCTLQPNIAISGDRIVLQLHTSA